MMPDKLRISTAYLERANLWSDICVLARTVMALFPSSRAPWTEPAWSSQQGGDAEPDFAEPVEAAEGQQIAENIG